MTLLTCAAVRRRLQAFHDRELPVRDLIDIESHLSDCPPCVRDLRELRMVGDGLRLAAAPGPADDWSGLQAGVISRMRAEAHESWAARTRRALDDMHLVWIGLGATAATCVCAFSVLSMLTLGAAERNDSLAAVIAVMAAPSGSDLNPAPLGGTRAWRAPSVPEDSIVFATLESGMLERDQVLAFSAVVSREGKVSGLETLTKDHDVRRMAHLLDALSRGRLEPAQFGGSPVAVNLVWLVAHTTVRAKFRS